MSNGQIFITIKNQNYELEESITLLELSKRFKKEYVSTIVAARVNNDIKELSFRIKENADISFIDLTDEDGMRIYRRSLYFIFIMAVHDVFPDRKAVISIL